MNDKRYRWILYTIVTVIVATIIIQVYFNYKNYQTNKQQFINDVQISLDKAVDDYYTALAERTTIGIFLEGDQQKDAFSEGGKIEKFLSRIDTVKHQFKDLDTIDINNIEGITVLKGFKVDSMTKLTNKKAKPSLSIEAFKKKVDSLKRKDSNVKLNNIEFLTSKIIVSIKNDDLDLNEIDSLLKDDLNRKKINLTSRIRYFEDHTDPTVFKTKDSISKNISKPNPKLPLSTTSNSKLLPKDSILKLDFSNETATVLKRGLAGILISTLLILAVIGCLFYLLKIIKNQKQLAEIKNDLISNITHEFKTPIATIGVALESISSFKGIDDKEKTKKYVNMSSEQLGKLNIMVEKLLETASLDSDNLDLNLASIDIIDTINTLTRRFKIQFPERQFVTNFNTESYLASVDPFHFENALNNILDNAIKYGGNKITVDLRPKNKHFEILISDTGTTLTKAYKERIFDKFYRVPKGNTHDVKGFGIGLYYTKSIIQKHHGTIDLELKEKLTTFKITLPNGS